MHKTVIQYKCSYVQVLIQVLIRTSAHTRVLTMLTVQTGPGQASVILALKQSLVKWPSWRFTFIRILHPLILDSELIQVTFDSIYTVITTDSIMESIGT